MSRGNPYHVPAGSPKGGQFTSAAIGAGISASLAAGVQPNIADIRTKFHEYQFERPVANEEEQLAEQFILNILYKAEKYPDMSTSLFEFDETNDLVGALEYTSYNDESHQLVLDVKALGAVSRGAGLKLTKRIIDLAYEKGASITADSRHFMQMRGFAKKFGFMVSELDYSGDTYSGGEYGLIKIPSAIVGSIYRYLSKRGK